MPATKYLSNLTILYANHSETQPDSYVKEVSGESPDINHGEKGYYVWLRPDWSSDSGNAISSISFSKQDNELRNYDDLALGAGGKYRYLTDVRNGEKKITKVALLRTSDKLSDDQIRARIAPADCEKWTSDINEDRGGDYLYFAWGYKED